ncbi:MAG TPA: cupredoxin domain-containing protein [Nitrososphaerales archaeon]|nr:cupredoxin domain-containing protein [Nitrososphaerales archaeon]
MEPIKVELGSSRSKHIGSILAVALIFAGLFAGFYAPSATGQSSVNVSIKSFSFNPGAIVVVIGVNNTVTWTNNDGVTHTVTSDDGTFGASLLPGQSYTFTFSTAGTFGYHCSIHTYMKGSVIVENPSSASTASTSLSTSVSTSSIATSTTSLSASASGTQTTSFVVASSTSNSGAGAIPEFPYGAAAVTIIILLVLTSYFLARHSTKPRSRALLHPQGRA